MSTKYIKYSLINTEPLCITDVYNSKSDEAAILSYIPGASIRGAVLNTIFTQYDSAISEQIKEYFFNGKIRFFNIYPLISISDNEQDLDINKEAIPVPKGFYEDRQASGPIVHIFNKNEFQKTKGKKRAKLGHYAYVSDDKLKFASPLMGEIFKIRLARNDNTETRSNKKKQQLFRGDYLAKNQCFNGYLSIDDDIAKKLLGGNTIEDILTSILNNSDIRLGSNKTSGYGSIQISDIHTLNARIPYENLSITDKYDGKTLEFDMLCLSNLCMTNEYLEPCGINAEELAFLLKCEDLEIIHASSSITHISAFNRKTGGRQAEYPVYEAGSIFRIRCKKAPSKEALQDLEEQGIGILRSEGLGRVIFLKNIENINLKEKCNISLYKPVSDANIPKGDIDELREFCALSILKNNISDAITEYVLAKSLQFGTASKNQIGQILTMCKSLRYRPLDANKEFEEYFKHIEDKEAASKTHRTQSGSQLKLRDSIMEILNCDILELLSQNNTIMNINTATLLSKKDTVNLKLKLIEELLHYENRKGKKHE